MHRLKRFVLMERSTAIFPHAGVILLAVVQAEDGRCLGQLLGALGEPLGVPRVARCSREDLEVF